MPGYLEAKNSIENEDFRMAYRKEKVGDSRTLEKNVSRCVENMCFVSGKRKRL